MPRSRAAAAATALGGVVTIIAGAFKWASTHGNGLTGKITGATAGYVTGAVLLVLGLAIWNWGFFRFGKVLLWVVAVANAGWTALLYGALDQSAKDATGPGSTFTLATGFYLLIAGTALVLVGAIIGAGAPKASASTTAPSAIGAPGTP